MRLLTIGCVLVTGCFSKPAFHDPGDGGGGDGDGSNREPLHGVTVVGNGVTDDMTMTTDDLQLHFPMAAINLPDQLKIGGLDVLAALAECNSENKIGLALYPSYSMTSGTATWPAQGTGDGHDSTIVRTEAGPAVAQATISWGGTFHCGAAVQMTSGQSVFTVFPDGRVVRDDTFTSPTTTALGGTACGCASGGGGNYFLTSYVALLNSAFSHLAYNASTNNLPMPMEHPIADLGDGDTVENPNPRWACMENRNAAQQRRFGIAWPASVMPTLDDGGTRIKLDIEFATPPTTTLIYDWDHENTTVSPGMRNVSVAWFVDSGPGASCAPATMNELFNGYAAARKLDVDSGAGVVKVPLDVHTGIYAVGSAAAPSYTIKVEDATTGVPPGFAIYLALPTDAAPKVTLDGALLVPGVDYLAQHTGTRHTLWFPTGLAQTQTLVISQ